MDSKTENNAFSNIRALPLALYFIYMFFFIYEFSNPSLNLSTTSHFIIASIILIASLGIAMYSYKKGLIRQPKKRLNMLTVAIVASGITYLVYLYFIVTA